MHLSIIGPGRLGRSLEILASRAGHQVELLREEEPNAPIVLLTVPDRAVPEVAARVPTGRIVLQCSGTTDWRVLRPHAPAGTWHPLMTFPGPEHGLPPLEGVPAAVAGDPAALEAATTLAESLDMRPIEVPGDLRLYHAAAVMAGNFATVLLADASRVLAAAGLPADQAPGLLAPLALQSLRNAAARGPAQTLTGPAARGDQATLFGHRTALDEAGLAALIPLHTLLSERARVLMESNEDEKAIVGRDPGANVETGT